jgi:hypothetical protein
MPPTKAVTQYFCAYAIAQAYEAWSIQDITVPPCTFPPKFTVLGSARKRSVMLLGCVVKAMANALAATPLFHA